MKKFDFTSPINNLDGNPTTDEKNQVFTFVKAIGLACINPLESDTSDQKYQDFCIGVKIVNNPQKVELSTEEISRIKEKVGKVFGPLIVGRVWDLLEAK